MATHYYPQRFESAYDEYRERYKDRVARIYDDIERGSRARLRDTAYEIGFTESEVMAAYKEGIEKWRADLIEVLREFGYHPETMGEYELEKAIRDLYSSEEDYEDAQQGAKDRALREAILDSPKFKGYGGYVDRVLGIPSRPTMQRWWDEYWRLPRGSPRDDYRLSHDEFELFLEVQFDYIHPYKRKKRGRKKGSTKGTTAPSPSPVHRGQRLGDVIVGLAQSTPYTLPATLGIIIRRHR